MLVPFEVEGTQKKKGGKLKLVSGCENQEEFFETFVCSC